MAYDPITGDYNISVRSSMILAHASEEAVARLVHDEVRDQLVNDPDFRILIKEGVREAMSRLNVSEVVEQAVKLVMAAKTEEK